MPSALFGPKQVLQAALGPLGGAFGSPYGLYGDFGHFSPKAYFDTGDYYTVPDYYDAEAYFSSKNLMREFMNGVADAAA